MNELNTLLSIGFEHWQIILLSITGLLSLVGIGIARRHIKCRRLMHNPEKIYLDDEIYKASDGLMVIDDHGKIKFASESMGALAGYAPYAIPNMRLDELIQDIKIEYLLHGLTHSMEASLENFAGEVNKVEIRMMDYICPDIRGKVIGKILVFNLKEEERYETIGLNVFESQAVLV